MSLRGSSISSPLLINDNEEIQSPKKDDNHVDIVEVPEAMGFQRQKDVAEKGEQQKLHGKIGKEKKRKEGEFPELPNFSLELRQEEISEDIYGMTGKTPSRTLRKREKNVQKQIEGVCCDAWKYISFSKDENAEQRTSKMGFFPRSDIYRIENKL
ncbi:uncharacterized protein LOC142517753 isoform X2 [Primulina tabacum]|uniref:uncharacterized protein LOC142517753 isoform X2 n=1 Tax=Primulina tabacum TaxID=48773 RepID=UPI003F596613